MVYSKFLKKPYGKKGRRSPRADFPMKIKVSIICSRAKTSKWTLIETDNKDSWSFKSSRFHKIRTYSIPFVSVWLLKLTQFLSRVKQTPQTPILYGMYRFIFKKEKKKHFRSLMCICVVQNFAKFSSEMFLYMCKEIICLSHGSYLCSSFHSDAQTSTSTRSMSLLVTFI